MADIDDENHIKQQIQAGLKLLGYYQGDDEAHAINGNADPGSDTDNDIKKFLTDKNITDIDSSDHKAVLEHIRTAVTSDPEITLQIWNQSSIVRGINEKTPERREMRKHPEQVKLFQGAMNLFNHPIAMDGVISLNKRSETRDAAFNFAKEQNFLSVDQVWNTYGKEFGNITPVAALTTSRIESYFDPSAYSIPEQKRGDRIISEGIDQVQLPTAKDMYDKGYTSFGKPTNDILQNPQANHYFALSYKNWMREHYKGHTDGWYARAFNGGPAWERIRDVKIIQAGLTAALPGTDVGGVDGQTGGVNAKSKTNTAITKFGFKPKDIQSPKNRQKIMKALQDNEAVKSKLTELRKIVGDKTAKEITKDHGRDTLRLLHGLEYIIDGKANLRGGADFIDTTDSYEKSYTKQHTIMSKEWTKFKKEHPEPTAQITEPDDENLLPMDENVRKDSALEEAKEILKGLPPKLPTTETQPSAVTTATLTRAGYNPALSLETEPSGGLHIMTHLDNFAKGLAEKAEVPAQFFAGLADAASNISIDATVYAEDDDSRLNPKTETTTTLETTTITPPPEGVSTMADKKNKSQGTSSGDFTWSAAGIANWIDEKTGSLYDNTLGRAEEVMKEYLGTPEEKQVPAREIPIIRMPRGSEIGAPKAKEENPDDKEAATVITGDNKDQKADDLQTAAPEISDLTAYTLKMPHSKAEYGAFQISIHENTDGSSARFIVTPEKDAATGTHNLMTDAEDKKLTDSMVKSALKYLDQNGDKYIDPKKMEALEHGINSFEYNSTKTPLESLTNSQYANVQARGALLDELKTAIKNGGYTIGEKPAASKKVTPVNTDDYDIFVIINGSQIELGISGSVDSFLKDDNKEEKIQAALEDNFAIGSFDDKFGDLTQIQAIESLNEKATRSIKQDDVSHVELALYASAKPLLVQRMRDIKLEQPLMEGSLLQNQEGNPSPNASKDFVQAAKEGLLQDSINLEEETSKESHEGSGEPDLNEFGLIDDAQEVNDTAIVQPTNKLQELNDHFAYVYAGILLPGNPTARAKQGVELLKDPHVVERLETYMRDTMMKEVDEKNGHRQEGIDLLQKAAYEQEKLMQEHQGSHPTDQFIHDYSKIVLAGINSAALNKGLTITPTDFSPKEPVLTPLQQLHAIRDQIKGDYGNKEELANKGLALLQKPEFRAAVIEDAKQRMLNDVKVGKKHEEETPTETIARKIEDIKDEPYMNEDIKGSDDDFLRKLGNTELLGTVYAAMKSDVDLRELGFDYELEHYPDGNTLQYLKEMFTGDTRQNVPIFALPGYEFPGETRDETAMRLREDSIARALIHHEIEHEGVLLGDEDLKHDVYNIPMEDNLIKEMAAELKKGNNADPVVFVKNWMAIEESVRSGDWQERYSSGKNAEYVWDKDPDDKKLKKEYDDKIIRAYYDDISKKHPDVKTKLVELGMVGEKGLSLAFSQAGMSLEEQARMTKMALNVPNQDEAPEEKPGPMMAGTFKSDPMA
ncbi:MAG: hypothetical protein DHS20C02_16440 [Micavibrio sp.]|nr:MAG: hypothetical protein DHS20C02_16440 [Micavibrio sp.]